MQNKRDEKKRNIAGVVCCIVAAGLILTGIINGDVRTVVDNAVGVCLQCIGIG